MAKRVSLADRESKAAPQARPRDILFQPTGPIITEEEKNLYLVDHIHPTKAGYKEWWLPKIRQSLYDITENK